MTMITTTVIICTRNRSADLARCLESLVIQTAIPQEIIVVDSSDVPLRDQQSFRDLFNAQRFPSVRLVYLHTNPGLTYQRNRGIEHATQDIVHFLDDDVILTSHYLYEMRKSFEENPAYAGGMGTITNIPVPARLNWHRLFRYIFLLQRDYSSGNFTASGMPTHAYGTPVFRRVQVLGGCCMAYRLWVFKKYLFDEKLVRYAFMEDCDFSRRVSYEHPLFYNPAAKLEHHPSPSNRDTTVDNRAMYIKNYRYLFYKNVYPYKPFARIALWWSIVGLFLEALLIRNRAHLKGYIQGLRNSL
jgi:GT2 family glycosyltransferase